MAKRVSGSVIRWSYISENMLPQDQQRIFALKSVSDRFARQVSERPAELPKIDWDYYKTRISAPGMLDSFKKGYEGLKIPYPSDQGALAATEASNDKMLKRADMKLQELLKELESLKKTLKEKEAMMRFSDMTVEEYLMAVPEARNDYTTPKFWPHTFDNVTEEKKDH